MRSMIMTICLMLCTTSFASATENPFIQFNSDVEKAYAVYRKALFQTNKNDAVKSGNANNIFIQQWHQVRKTYGSNPPEVFSSDPKWESTLSNIEGIAQKSAAQIQNGNLAEAHEILEGIRDELTDLRKRNSVIVFSDHVNNYHEVMERLLVGGYTPDKINEGALREIRGQLAVLDYLGDAIKENAPARYKEDQQYQKLEKGLLGSLKALDKALESGDPATISKSVKMLKPAYAKLFVNFG
ncbi:hypothetical protein [Desulfopila sp. IMCC35008]|uniref:hypothetical protein n=1 Tax=Desulfopila sp. IMCC35008 TaxID=2653858 RepID=UPI0013D6ED49|nr:hypothetical protein [Desulfopila sp. IMCC35008]